MYSNTASNFLGHLKKYFPAGIRDDLSLYANGVAFHSPGLRRTRRYPGIKLMELPQPQRNTHRRIAAGMLFLIA